MESGAHESAGSEGKVAGYVMAGGASLRFGSDKALAEFAGKTLLFRMCELVKGVAGPVHIVAPCGRYAVTDILVVEDRWPDEGPLGGIITGIHATAGRPGHEDWNLIVSCDIAFLLRDQPGVTDEDVAAYTGKLARELEVEDVLEKVPSELSTGTKRAVAIARALAQNP